ncbi:hypothetical protein [Mesorhizobium carmichaelinearum]|uniref:hypothetical protein n=1 Tax=Mesorhizobium carmichaelinearum TaxID=1208188 RepID=UPI00117D932B|nr:hypothetical protein [Mesorhizobium carmichaelinearum]
MRGKGLPACRKALVGAAPDDEHWTIGTPLYWAAMVYGIGMLLIRVSSSHGWWTGHLMECRRRSARRNKSVHLEPLALPRVSRRPVRGPARISLLALR